MRTKVRICAVDPRPAQRNLAQAGTPRSLASQVICPRKFLRESGNRSVPYSTKRWRKSSA
ncbi:MAG: hypothetical protein A2Z34_12050 [Planctomycetes bacterium RBG_16_59_8]|nr:MAG: hypothetical protein A2Z34_12050 [Planctomycetes bacterium RBG_16_59_8]